MIGVALGSNAGDRRKCLDEAVDFLQTIAPLVALSSYYVSQPVDCPPGSAYFYNAVAQLRYDGDLLELLARLQQYELASGRTPQPQRQACSPRPIDLDILYADRPLTVGDRLTLPHPRLARRLFVLEPLAEIAPDLLVPGGEPLPVSALLARCRREFGKEQVCLKIV